MGDLFNKTVLMLLIPVGAYGFWRHLTVKRITSCEVDDTSKEQYSASFDKHSCSLTEKDHLSEIPDDLWPYILLLLSLRDVARLATLSKKLRNICFLLPCLDLDWCVMSGMPDYVHSEKCELYKATYVKNVYQVLQNYRDQTIVSLRLSCCFDNRFADDVDRWISVAAASKHLQSLFLRFSCLDLWYMDLEESRNEGLKSIKFSLFCQFTSLRELHLQWCILKVENDVRLCNLTTLDLNEVILEGTEWQGFLASFSTVKCLCLRMCNLPSKLCIGDDFPQLSFLQLAYCLNLEILEVSARNLTTFEFMSFHDVDCSFYNVPRLENVGLYLTSLTCRNFLNLAAANASSLTYMFIHKVEELINLPPSPEGRLFTSVSSLTLTLAASQINRVMAVPKLLNFFPFLRRLELELPLKPPGEKYELSYSFENLKEVRLLGFQVGWIPFAIFLLKSAMVLDCMVLSIFRNIGWGSESRCFTDEFLEGCQGSKSSILSKKECNYIRIALMGEAISTTAKVVIETPPQM